MARPKRGSKTAVDPEALLALAFELYRDAGDVGFSVRKVAAQAGVDPMTVLHHFGSKRELLRDIADRALGAVQLPKPTADWRADLRAVAAAYRQLAHRYPRIFHLHFQFHATGPVDHAASEIVYRAMRAAGLNDHEAAEQGLSYYAFVLGFALAETEGLMQPISATDEAELLGLDATQFPVSRALVPAFRQLDSDVAFRRAVDAYLIGLTATHRADA